MISLCRLLLTSLIPALALIACSGVSVESADASAARNPMEQPVAIDGDWLTVGGERFLVVGVGYEIGARPGRIPWDHDHQPDLLHKDFRRIREAGFNTIRTWAPLSDAELQIAAEYGLWVIQGIWIDPGGDFDDPAFQQEALEQIRREVSRSARHPNILYYLLMNEPHGDAVQEAGRENVEEFLRSMAAAARAADPSRPASFSNCVVTDYLDVSMFPVTSHNAYPYSPLTIDKALHYRTYLETIKRRLAPDKPLVITEFGLSVSPSGDGRGYGGNSLERQRDGVVQIWDDQLNAGAAGGCAFMWIDGWWKRGDPDSHDDHAEEWYGLLEAETDYEGAPRPVYHALAEYNRAVRISPNHGRAYAGTIPVTVWGPDLDRAQYRIDESDWHELARVGRWWWEAHVEVSTLTEGWHTLQTRGLTGEGNTVSEKRCVFGVSPDPESLESPLVMSIISPRGTHPVAQTIQVEVRVTNADGDAVAGVPISLGRFVHMRWDEDGTEAVTGADGTARGIMRGFHSPAVVSIAAGASLPLSFPGRRFGDSVHVVLTEQ